MSTIATPDTYPCGYAIAGPSRDGLIAAQDEYKKRGTQARTVNFTLDDSSLLLGYVTDLKPNLANDDNVAADKRGYQFTVTLLTVDRERYVLKYNAHNRSARVSVVIAPIDE